LEGNSLITLGDIIKTSQSILGKTVKITETDASKISVRNVSNDRAKKFLGWQPEMSLEEGLSSLLQYI